MAVDFNSDNENLFKMLLARNNKSFGANGFGGGSFGNGGVQGVATNTSFNPYMEQAFTGQGRQQSADGGNSGDNGGKINPVKMALGVAQSGVNIANAVMQPKFNYGQDNYTAEQAGQAEGQRASNIGKSVGSAIPVVGGLLGGIFGLIGQKIAQNKGEQKANMILGNRKTHMNNLEDYQMKKIQDNNFLKSSDMYKNMLNNNQNF